MGGWWWRLLGCQAMLGVFLVGGCWRNLILTCDVMTIKNLLIFILCI